MSSKYGEPWAQPEYDNDLGYDGGFWEWYEVEDVGKFSDEDKALRAIACVNACASLENPADLRTQRDDLLTSLEWALRWGEAMYEGLQAPLKASETVWAFREATALVKKARGEA